MDFHEYLVIVKTSDGQKRRIVIHARDAKTAHRMAEQATEMTVVEMTRQS